MPVAVDASKTLLSGITSTTWGNRPSSAGNGQMYLFTDVGASGTIMRYSGSRWRPLAGQARLASLGAAVTGIANTPVIALQTLLPIAAWQPNDTIRIYIATSKSGAVDSGSLNIYIGTTGTTADAAVAGLSAITFMSAANRTYAQAFEIKLTGSTAAQKIGGTSGLGLYQGASNNAVPAATTIADATTNALYISVALNSTGTTDTLSLTAGSIQLITP